MKMLIQDAIIDARHLLLLRETSGDVTSFEISIFARLIQRLKEAEALASAQIRIDREFAA